MRIVSEKTVRNWAARHPDAENWLKGWIKTAERADWTSLRDVRRQYPHADGVPVASGRIATVFNVSGNKYRMVTSIHYNRGIVFTLFLLTHAEYSKDT
jgi:mRNA interferase HigB